MNYFESESTVMTRYEVILPDTVKDLIGKNRQYALRTEYGILSGIAKRVDSFYSRNTSGDDLIEYAGIAKTIVKDLEIIKDAVTSVDQTCSFDVTSTSAAIAHLWARLHGMQRKIELSILK